MRRSLRDLVAATMLPAVWLNYDARQIAESVAEVLVRMIGLEFACVAFRPAGDAAIEVARVRERAASGQSAAIGAALRPWLDKPPAEVAVLVNPVGSGFVRVAFSPVHSGQNGAIAAASRSAEFPSARERLLLDVVANQAAIALRRCLAESALQGLNETLEQRVAAEIDTRMKVEEVLRQSQKMEAIGRLTGGIAHDFNNLLTVVIGNLTLLRKRLPSSAKDLRLIDGALEGAQRGAALTQRLLAFARQQDLKAAPVDAAALVRGMTGMLHQSTGPMVDVDVEFPADLWPASVDANQLELALLNLAVNARDAMPNGGRLRLSGRNATIAADDGGSLAPGDYVCLAVTDTGDGMDEATLGRATDPFFTTKGVGEGTGLGLSMVEGTAVQSGGALRLKSRLGDGTTAELWLPRASAPAAAAAATAPAPAESGRPCTVLLVDDDPLICTATAEMLKDLGHEVVEAQSGGKALEMLRAGRAVDVVVTDQAMPGMTGIQLAAEIRATWPDLPVVLATGYAELPRDDDLSLPRVRKPYEQEKLATVIASLVRAGTPPRY